ncbi:MULTISPECIES: tRNA isopentenyl-2-thiomethyl-A-37 hydroxylase MiaE [Shewanella]|uniref:tRNA isopentenyl-2-thiomethyl-A-37 hydroxylase MiaE n=1 Tax=Shewanella TaxID=22 RepID=UPI001C65C15A|nr:MULTISPECIES: tRNA isopentenyl-2-thiomethyl-A-37 hydroxylase MiaE [Shewanella]QYJ92563.1 tRNA isopentenyl-2-thiomethyl-A-37 hydroxylase MiaE [Shewanella spartinae]QYJ96446.1 tRNA isopentenyl-2-thiomethyl-A-37 hydroxylase MiaE [Shewanella alkalitolerans]
MQALLAPIKQFLQCETPDEWIALASQSEQLAALLIDHCNCELKAAQTAMFLIRKYAVDKASGDQLLQWAKPYEEFVYNKSRDIDAFLARDVKKNELVGELTAKDGVDYGQDLIAKMVRLIKEEFHHFEQVLEIMQARGIPYQNLTAGRYAKGMMRAVRTHEPATLVDKLIVGAFIEARSCERFAKLAPYLDEGLSKFYVSLLRSEARHYQDYLVLAQAISPENIDERVAHFAKLEAELISAPDSEFKFHSGRPETC